ncbi:MAG: hypothetical protein Kow0098_03870 [Ignavibacteriaceae bacterium]
MKLTKKQRIYIEKNKNKLSADEIASSLGVEKKAVVAILKQSGEKKPAPKIFYLILVLIPVLFFIFLELGLRIFGYGHNNNQWINATAGKLILNPEIGRRYFHSTNSLPYSNQEVFDAEKKENAFRVFVLGGSSTAGFPYAPLGSFSRYIQKRLEIVYPASVIEVVNLGITAVNSYTIRDIFPGVIEQKPDLIIIYAGHNEYYGALGVGSTENFGSSVFLINLYLSLYDFKTVQLLTDLLGEITGLFNNKEVRSDATLMARMVKEKYIPFRSDLYYKGIEQFESNMRDVMEMAKESGVPVILSTLTSNLRDQFPFVSEPYKNYPPAAKIFSLAKKELESGNIRKADSLFVYAKELDALRFRAPGKINEIIRSFGKEFLFPVVDIDSAFRSVSKFGIVGNEFMTDHLHPTLRGYQYMGKVFYEAMTRLNLMPEDEPLKLTPDEQDSLTLRNFHFSSIDSTLGEYRIAGLKNDWPFVPPEKKKKTDEIIKPANYLDSLAFDCVEERINWEECHRMAAEWYLKKGDIRNFKEQMDILISQFPVIVEYYNYVANELMKRGMYDDALTYVQTRYELRPDAYSTKWLGIINLSKGNPDTAIDYLLQSVKFNPNDEQVLYNLAGAYVNKKEYKTALEYLKKSLQINPEYSAARKLEEQLKRVLD